jgi:hypothetical protein
MAPMKPFDDGIIDWQEAGKEDCKISADLLNWFSQARWRIEVGVWSGRSKE